MKVKPLLASVGTCYKKVHVSLVVWISFLSKWCLDSRFTVISLEALRAMWKSVNDNVMLGNVAFSHDCGSARKSTWNGISEWHVFINNIPVIIPSETWEEQGVVHRYLGWLKNYLRWLPIVNKLSMFFTLFTFIAHELRIHFQVHLFFAFLIRQWDQLLAFYSVYSKVLSHAWKTWFRKRI